MAAEGLIPEEAPPLPFGSGGRPWFVSLVMGVAGWLASLFCLVAVFLLFDPNTPVGAGILGAIMLGLGFGLYAADRDDAFFGQLALALSLAGQLALMYAIGEATDSAVTVAAFAAVISGALVLWLPNHFAKGLSAFFACLAWAFVVRLGWWGDDLFGQRRLEVPFLPALTGWLIIWVPVGGLVHTLIRRETRWMATSARRVARPALTGLLLGLSVGTWASEPFAALPFTTPPTEIPENWLVLWPLLGALAALFAAGSAFRLRHRAMIGGAIGGALLHVVHFYYLLGVSLVVKSYIMLALGAMFLVGARSVGAGGGQGVTPGRERPGGAPAGGTFGRETP